MKIARLFLLTPLMGLFFMMGCVSPTAKLPPLVETVIVLPFDSESNNVDAPDIMQRLVYLAMVPSRYRVLNIEETNATLKEKGIIDGGQLAAVDPVKLGKDLGVQGLIYGNVESFGYTNLGVYVSRKVVLELKLIDTTSGETLWQNVGKMATRKFGFDEESIKKNFVKGLANQMTDKVFKSPLEKEAKLATQYVLRTLTGFRFAGFAKDAQTQSGLKKGAKGVIKEIIRQK